LGGGERKSRYKRGRVNPTDKDRRGLRRPGKRGVREPLKERPIREKAQTEKKGQKRRQTNEISVGERNKNKQAQGEIRQ